jgi:hypothetical protein
VIIIVLLVFIQFAKFCGMLKTTHDGTAAKRTGNLNLPTSRSTVVVAVWSALMDHDHNAMRAFPATGNLAAIADTESRTLKLRAVISVRDGRGRLENLAAGAKTSFVAIFAPVREWISVRDDDGVRSSSDHYKEAEYAHFLE